MSNEYKYHVKLTIWLDQQNSNAGERLQVQQFRLYASGALSKAEIQSRSFLLKLFNQVNGDRLRSDSAFKDDLGLNSLDVAEILMSIENEYSIEIPDDKAKEIQYVDQVIKSVAEIPEAK
ncbi:hypothetical protein E3P89_03146 [Wallemia ichthyophaga]|uniref:Acyl carrier protein n=1 Tax=Wallemia ichthyophaga TaxID=245174 RepID=A0A4T0H6E8_WALIC|nr:hypothetical protein E3P96_03183 [Wallemia ichthyophaga]TIB09627.1 hypothetical protein E3P93_03136 [Wallemia ichthyophaga]TIB09721.1 hypothetical protein E3P90_03167 [Wallemia ichthyophaga]TIB20564.1 hypothetical protein E3P89_03146 [Wallemia ichthyophaga]TIB22178.1 hypothetical protein E3P88_03180 [Wallemia ichthyophaga]